jgi:hypothetical protein
VAIIGTVVVGGFEVEPAETGVVDGEPGMRGIGADGLVLAGWGQGLEIAADVARPGRAPLRTVTLLGRGEVLAEGTEGSIEHRHRSAHIR